MAKPNKALTTIYQQTRKALKQGVPIVLVEEAISWAIHDLLNNQDKPDHVVSRKALNRRIRRRHQVA